MYSLRLSHCFSFLIRLISFFSLVMNEIFYADQKNRETEYPEVAKNNYAADTLHQYAVVNFPYRSSLDIHLALIITVVMGDMTELALQFI